MIAGLIMYLCKQLRQVALVKYRPSEKFRLSHREVKFLLGFVAIYTCLHMLYFLVPDVFLSKVIYHYGIVSLSAVLINLIQAGEAVVADENFIKSSKAVLEVVRGCDGAGVLFLMSAAIVSFAAKWKMKLLGLIGAFLLFYLLNQLRIVGLYFVVAYQRELFAPLHTYFIPTLIIIIGCIFFAWWAQLAHNDKRAAV